MLYSCNSYRKQLYIALNLAYVPVKDGAAFLPLYLSTLMKWAII